VTAYGDSGAGAILSFFGIPGAFPYTAEEEARTRRFTPASRAATRRSRVPVPFTECARSGSAMEPGTETKAASWKTPSTPLQAPARRGGPSLSPRQRRGPGPRCSHGCRGEVVEDHDLVAPCQEEFHDVGADETGSSGDQDVHELVPFVLRRLVEGDRDGDVPQGGYRSGVRRSKGVSRAS